MITPCKDCPDRVIGCHDKCARYRAFREDLEGRKPKNYADNDITSYIIKNRIRNAARHGYNPHRDYKKEQ